MRTSFTTTGFVATLLACGQLAAAHMEMSFPAPFRSKFNPNSDPGSIDYTMTAPLSQTGSDYPCKGYHKDFGTPAGKPTATFAPGSSYNFSITGGAAHGGGSCQASLSYDGGKTFVIPSDAQTGDAIFAWTWHNQIGNREMYMNCAAVTIGGGSAKREEEEQKLAERDVAFSARPQIFVANVGNGCTTVETFDVEYPAPGPEVVEQSSKLKPPAGRCAAVAVGGGAADSNPGSGSSSSSAVVAAPAPATSAAAPVSTTAAPVASSSSARLGGIFITVSTDSAASATAVQPSATASSVSASAPVVVVPTSTAAAATTLQTATKSSSASLPAGTGSSSGSTGAFAVGEACTDEGAWNCIAGTSFQRCASGSWSAVIAMAAGTKCTAGVSDTLAYGKRSIVRRAGAKFRFAATA
ncbi:hypothetical protein B0T17DRAFT_649675 [Bombardia bombarda]|uniref:Uncharacterized protein n=1 Tax=Bombardia bombarda TaxID=252184 RepID=A0AA39XJ03_9PEZI|nr:hypothetical protein B0T17DRAFT_649675 [Bombardia bombarda]